MPDENGNPLPGENGFVAPEVVNTDGKPLNESDETTEVNAVTAKPTEVAIVSSPTPPEQVEEPIAEQPVIVDELAATQEAVVETPQNADQPTNPELYTVQVADLNAYPELSQQGVQLYDQVIYGSLYVWKHATAANDSVVQEPWPRAIGSEKAKGITFNG